MSLANELPETALTTKVDALLNWVARFKIIHPRNHNRRL